MKPTLAYLLALAVAICIPLYRMASADTRMAVAADSLVTLESKRLDADLVTSYEAANIVMDLYKQIGMKEDDAGILAKAEAYMAQRGVLKGWKPIKEAAKH